VDYAIIVAGGKGKRMGSSIPKQFLMLEGRPVLMHTLVRFHEALPACKLILVLPQDCMDEWRDLCIKCDFDLPLSLAAGGLTRFDSVKNGLSLIPEGETGVVGIHDGVRPFVNVDVIRHCYERARISGAVVPSLKSVESVRLMSKEHDSKAIDRNCCFLVQTPQVFQIELLKKAYRLPYQDFFTDDASVVENFGVRIEMVDGNRENIKITSPFDMVLARAFLDVSKEKV
jgi:2-C-methyl-D-erythritol 4-phosphate cytidylyltransferase